MKIASATSILPAIVAAASLTFASSAFTPANAYSVTANNAIILNPGETIPLDDMHWLVPASTTRGDGTALGLDLSAIASVTVNTLSDTVLNLSFNITNTTDASLDSLLTNFQLAVEGSTTPEQVRGFNPGLASGQNETFDFTFEGNFRNGVTIATYPVTFTAGSDTFKAEGVPEPITVIGSGLALGFGALFKREASKKRNKAKTKS